MSTGAWVVVAAVVLAVGVGLWRSVADGRFADARRGRTPSPSASDARAPDAGATPDEGDDDAVPAGALLVSEVGGSLGPRATLLQFSTAFCAPCRATRRVLGEVSDLVEGVVHVEVDAEHHLDATRTFGILRTPTTLVLDARGREVTRAAGAPSRDQVLTALARV